MKNLTLICSGSDVICQLSVFLAASVRSSSVHELFPPDCFPVDHSFDGCSAAKHFSLMRALLVVVMQPFIQIGLQRVHAVVKFLAERDLIKLLQDRLMEALAHTVGLR